MKNNFLIPALCVLCFGMGIGINNIAMSDTNKTKIAFVDINRLIATSQNVKEAQNIRDIKTKEMLKWYDGASDEIEKQQTKEAKDMLIKKYEAQLTQKKKNIKDSYTKELIKADIQIESAISKKSKELGYNLVFRKDALIVGGEDITSQILPLVK